MTTTQPSPRPLAVIRESIVVTDHTMTQLELALKSGVSPSTIAGIEQGRQEPRINAAMRIARALNVSVEEIAWPDVEQLAKHRKKGRAEAA